MRRLLMVIVLLVCGNGAAAAEESAADPNAPAAPPARRGVNFRLFQDAGRPVTGAWLLEMPGMPARRILISQVHEASPDALVGRDAATQDEVFRLDRKKDGIGYEGQMRKVLSECGLDVVPVTEYVPIGDAVVVTWLARPTEAECPAMELPGSGRYVVNSPGGRAMRLRTLSEISSSRVRNQYNIGGEAESRVSTEVSYTVPVGSVSVDAGTEVRMLRRLKAPLDGSYWFEVEVPLAVQQDGITPPKGFMGADALQFIGSLTLRRAQPD